MFYTIKDYEKDIAEAIKEIEDNKYNKSFFEPTPIIDMHDTGCSRYEAKLADISFCKTKIEQLKEEAKRKEEKEKKLAFKAEKLGLTLEEYKEKLNKEYDEKARKAKIKRYYKELEKINERKAYIEKWLKENED